MVDFAFHINLAFLVARGIGFYFPNNVINVASSNGQVRDIVGILNRFSNDVVVVIILEKVNQDKKISISIPLRKRFEVFISQTAVF